MTDIRQLVGDEQQALKLAMLDTQSRIWTALPGIIDQFDPDTMTAVIHLAIRGTQQAPDGGWSQAPIYQLVDVPVVFPHGGGCSLTFPLAKDDECLVAFASRCIDAWWQSGGMQVAMDQRMHDLSDAFAIPGPYSQVKKPGNISRNTTQLRSHDGSTFVELDPVGRLVNVVAPGGMKITAPTVEITGCLLVNKDLQVQEGATVAGQITGQGGMAVSGGDGAMVEGDLTASGTVIGQTDVIAAGKSGAKHEHISAAPGSPTSPPV